MQPKSLAATVIGFSLVPLLAVLLVTLAAPGQPARWFAGGAVILGIAGFVAVSLASGASPKRGQPDFEAAQARYMNRVVIAAALAVATLGTLFGQASKATPVVVSVAVILWSLLWLPRATRGIGIRTSVVIGRDVATVFNFVADESNSPRWEEVLASEKITDGPIGQGTRFRFKTATFEGVEEITDFEPPTRLTSSLVTALRPNRTVLTFESVAGGTRIDHSFETELSYPGALLGQGLLRWMMTASMSSGRNRAWQRLKALLESGTTP